MGSFPTPATIFSSRLAAGRLVLSQKTEVRILGGKQKQISDGKRRSAGMNSTVGPERVQSLFLFGVVAQLAERYICNVKDEGSNPFCSTKRNAERKCLQRLAQW